MAGLALLAAAALVPGRAAGAPAPRLPDLDQAAPGQIGVVQAGSRFRLGFSSAVDNIGAGPLIVRGHRAASESRMTADQGVRLADGSTEMIPGVGRLSYVTLRDHQHWHYVGFDRFLLRRVSDGAKVGRDRKTGFCLGDRYNTDPGTTLPTERGDPVFTADCGLSEPQLLSVREGISVGWGDIYEAQLEGQFVDITGLAPGRYYLIHRVNANRALAERRYSNNAASARIDLRWPHGFSQPPHLQVLRVCAARARCP